MTDYTVRLIFVLILQKRLGLYDFSFEAWPVDYKWDESKAEYVMQSKICFFKLGLDDILICTIFTQVNMNQYTYTFLLRNDIYSRFHFMK